ncbi:hypothetical protein BDF19DRAFT_433624 [Syncephalis fuscata]|nr:hypothetical protein BDF19DRAFT_433624 [Syncephalis fuscata]
MKLSAVAICTVAIIFVASVATVDAEPMPNSQAGSQPCSRKEARTCKGKGRVCMKVCNTGPKCIICPIHIPPSQPPSQKE